MHKTRITQRSRQKKRKSGKKNENKTAQAKKNPEQNQNKNRCEEAQRLIAPPRTFAGAENLKLDWREIPVRRKGRGQAGGGKYERESKRISRKPHTLEQSYSEQQYALGFMFAQFCSTKSESYLSEPRSGISSRSHRS